jgi:hypothetical protein
MNPSHPSLSRRHLLAAGAGLALASRFPGGRALALGAEPVAITPDPISDPASYDAYIPTACKTGPFFEFTCEFDAAWAVLTTFGADPSFEQQLAAIAIDHRIEPYFEENDSGFVISGGDIVHAYSGDYTNNFLARTTGPAMRSVFKKRGLYVSRVHDRPHIEKQLRLGRLIWIKTTVDFNDWRTATWITPDGAQMDVVLGNDHAVVVIGYTQDVVVIRDVLGPTSTNWQRPYELEVPWETFLHCWSAQHNDGLAVGLKDVSSP